MCLTCFLFSTCVFLYKYCACCIVSSSSCVCVYCLYGVQVIKTSTDIAIANTYLGVVRIRWVMTSTVVNPRCQYVISQAKSHWAITSYKYKDQTFILTMDLFSSYTVNISNNRSTHTHTRTLTMFFRLNLPLQYMTLLTTTIVLLGHVKTGILPS